ncbi:uncharacterized protein LOC123563884 [Mercenaria mercenaria]|uniref:uncharacterized protein LOC123563884 n=1 Tax=Mercenaria mercenaria TaxID=6596 RepID=UPI00234FB241|nr:uncharacterized protein LOC123563884 [Mercenaria mercenaria]
MAEGGDLPQAVLEEASEEIYDYNCSPCDEAGVYKEAHKYCDSCKLYYCKKCLGEHNKFPALRGHLIKDVTYQTNPSGSTGTAGISVPAVRTEPCENHPEEMIKMFCGEHDLVCCSVCIALDHRECKDVHYIQNLAKDIRKSPEYTEYAEEVTRMKTVYEDTKQSIQDEIEKMSDIKTEIISEIKEYKRDLVSRIEELESRSVETVNERYKQILGRLNATARNVNDLLDEVTDLVREIDNVGETQLFVRMKTMSPMRDKKSNIDKDLQTLEELSFSLDNSIRNTIEHVDGLATANVPVKTLSKKEYDILFDDDEYNKYDVRDMCILEYDTLVMTCNDRLKRFSRSFDKLANISAPGQLCGICKTSRSNELAVSIRDKETIQFAQYTAKSISLTQSFTVGVPCKGICSKDDYLFVTCGGGYEDIVLGHVRQYDMQGYLIRTIDTDHHDRPIFTSPRFMSCDFWTNTIYIADRDNGIIVLDINGKVFVHPYNSFLKNVFGICLTTRKDIILSGSDSYNIQQYDENFRHVGTILNFTDEMRKPLCTLLDVSTKQLIVSLVNDDKVYVYDVEC